MVRGEPLHQGLGEVHLAVHEDVPAPWDTVDTGVKALTFKGGTGGGRESQVVIGGFLDEMIWNGGFLWWLLMSLWVFEGVAMVVSWWFQSN